MEQNTAPTPQPQGPPPKVCKHDIALHIPHCPACDERVLLALHNKVLEDSQLAAETLKICHAACDNTRKAEVSHFQWARLEANLTSAENKKKLLDTTVANLHRAFLQTEDVVDRVFQQDKTGKAFRDMAEAGALEAIQLIQWVKKDRVDPRERDLIAFVPAPMSDAECATVNMKAETSMVATLDYVLLHPAGAMQLSASCQRIDPSYRLDQSLGSYDKGPARMPMAEQHRMFGAPAIFAAPEDAAQGSAANSELDMNSLIAKMSNMRLTDDDHGKPTSEYEMRCQNSTYKQFAERLQSLGTNPTDTIHEHAALAPYLLAYYAGHSQQLEYPWDAENIVRYPKKGQSKQKQRRIEARQFEEEFDGKGLDGDLCQDEPNDDTVEPIVGPSAPVFLGPRTIAGFSLWVRTLDKDKIKQWALDWHRSQELIKQKLKAARQNEDKMLARGEVPLHPLDRSRVPRDEKGTPYPNKPTEFHHGHLTSARLEEDEEFLALRYSKGKR